LFIQPKELVTVDQDETDIKIYYDETISFLKGTIEVIQAVCRESVNASISFALSGQPCCWEDVTEKYLFLSRLLNFRIGTGTEMLLVDSEFKTNIINTSSEAPELSSNIEPLEMLLTQKKLDAIELYLESGQRDKFFNILSELTDPLKTIKNRKNGIAMEIY